MVWRDIGGGDMVWVDMEERREKSELEKDIRREIERCERQLEYLQQILEQQKRVEDGTDIENAIEDESDKENRNEQQPKS